MGDVELEVGARDGGSCRRSAAAQPAYDTLTRRESQPSGCGHSGKGPLRRPRRCHPDATRPTKRAEPSRRSKGEGGWRPRESRGCGVPVDGLFDLGDLPASGGAHEGVGVGAVGIETLCRPPGGGGESPRGYAGRAVSVHGHLMVRARCSVLSRSSATRRLATKSPSFTRVGGSHSRSE